MKRKAVEIEEEVPQEKIAIPKLYPWFQRKVEGYLEGHLTCSKCGKQKHFKFMDMVNNNVTCTDCYVPCSMEGCNKNSESTCIPCGMRMCSLCTFTGDSRCRRCIVEYLIQGNILRGQLENYLEMEKEAKERRERELSNAQEVIEYNEMVIRGLEDRVAELEENQR